MKCSRRAGFAAEVSKGPREDIETCIESKQSVRDIAFPFRSYLRRIGGDIFHVRPARRIGRT